MNNDKHKCPECGDACTCGGMYFCFHYIHCKKKRDLMLTYEEMSDQEFLDEFGYTKEEIEEMIEEDEEENGQEHS